MTHWKCINCDTSNFSDISTCDVCGSERYEKTSSIPRYGRIIHCRRKAKDRLTGVEVPKRTLVYWVPYWGVTETKNIPVEIAELARAVEPGMWRCSQCEHINLNDVDQCSACKCIDAYQKRYKSRSGSLIDNVFHPKSPTTHWICFRCETQNHGHVGFCDVCSSDKEGSSAGLYSEGMSDSSMEGPVAADHAGLSIKSDLYRKSEHRILETTHTSTCSGVKAATSSKSGSSKKEAGTGGHLIAGGLVFVLSIWLIAIGTRGSYKSNIPDSTTQSSSVSPAPTTKLNTTREQTQDSVQINTPANSYVVNNTATEFLALETRTGNSDEKPQKIESKAVADGLGNIVPRSSSAILPALLGNIESKVSEQDIANTLISDNAANAGNLDQTSPIGSALSALEAYEGDAVNESNPGNKK